MGTWRGVVWSASNPIRCIHRLASRVFIEGIIAIIPIGCIDDCTTSAPAVAGIGINVHIVFVLV
ncbi:MAG TPA: hypothetical protein PLZ51_28400 [Aggregatilineales bacterium]|nr:hypothetical protein [Aggregatilineales bacterium]